MFFVKVFKVSKTGNKFDAWVNVDSIHAATEAKHYDNATDSYEHDVLELITPMNEQVFIDLSKPLEQKSLKQLCSKNKSFKMPLKRKKKNEQRLDRLAAIRS